MARTKFTFEKRQKELAKRKKKEEKTARRAEAKRMKTGAEPGSGEERGIDGMDGEMGPAGEMTGNASPDDPDSK